MNPKFKKGKITSKALVKNEVRLNIRDLITEFMEVKIIRFQNSIISQYHKTDRIANFY